MGSISHHITPLVINSLGGGHTHTHTHTHAYIRTETILRNQARAGLRPARAWFKNGIGIEGQKVRKQVRDQRNGAQVLLENENKS